MNSSREDRWRAAAERDGGFYCPHRDAFVFPEEWDAGNDHWFGDEYVEEPRYFGRPPEACEAEWSQCLDRWLQEHGRSLEGWEPVAEPGDLDVFRGLD